MPTALHIAGLASQPHQGVGARLVRRLGGAVRSVIVRGIALAGTLRRPATPQDPQPPAPRRVRQPRPALPATLLPPPLLAHLLAARRHRHPATASRHAFLNQGDTPFTPEAYPQLSPKACAVLNTPLKDCDPKTLELVFSAFTQHINQIISPEAGIMDPAVFFPNLWHRLSTALAETKADASLSTTAEAVPPTPADTVRDAPLMPPHPPVQAPPTGPTRLWTNDAPRLAPVPLSGPTASDHPAAVAPKTQPDIAAPSGPVGHRSRPFRYGTQSFARRRRRHVRRCRAFVHARGVRDGLQCVPPPRRLCHAACTGPP